MGIVNSMARKAARSKKADVLDYVRTGWNNYSFVFYIGGISAILGSLFGVAGWLSTIITVYFFYIMGRFKKELDREKERIERKRKAAQERRK